MECLCLEAVHVDAPLLGGEGLVPNVECVPVDRNMVDKYNL